jgi:hypothetical protein
VIYLLGKSPYLAEKRFFLATSKKTAQAIYLACLRLLGFAKRHLTKEFFCQVAVITFFTKKYLEGRLTPAFRLFVKNLMIQFL